MTKDLENPEDTVDQYAGDIYAQYPFLDETKNELFLPSNQTLAPFFDKLHELEISQKNQVHVVHIGDSHIQADFFTGKVRTLFKEDFRFPMTSRGFTFPYRAAKTNNPQDYRVTYSGEWLGKKSVKRREFSQWGLSGINAITYAEEATLTINPNREYNDYDIKKVKLFYPVFDRQSYEVELVLDAGNQMTSKLMSDGYIEFRLLKPQKSVTFKLKKTAPGQVYFILQGVMLESDRPGLTYSATGVNGAEVATYFRCEDFSANLAQINPDLIVISLGTNDAYVPNFDANLFKSNYKKLIADIRKLLPKVPILLTTVGDSYRRRKPNRSNELASDAILNLGKEMNVGVWDFFRVMGGFKSIKSWREQNLTAKDLLHLSKGGYELQGELFFQALDIAYEQYCIKFNK